MIKSSLVGLVLTAAVQATSPQLQENEYIKTTKETTKQKVSKIIIDDYNFIAEKLKRLEEYSGKACKIIDPQSKNIGNTKLITASYDCKVSGGSTVTFHVGQTIGPEKKISENESCVDLGLYFRNSAGQLQIGVGAGITVKNKKGSENIFYTDMSCEQLSKGKIRIIKEIQNRRYN